MATQETWNSLRYFKKDSTIDNWGNADLISDDHLYKLDDFRHHLGLPVIVLHGVEDKGHAKNSYHHSDRACATDVVIPGYRKSSFDLILTATRFGFTGIGYYPHWQYGGERVGGLHLDSRPLHWNGDERHNYAHSRWLGVLNDDGKQIYIAMNYPNLLKFS